MLSCGQTREDNLGNAPRIISRTDINEDEIYKHIEGEHKRNIMSGIRCHIDCYDYLEDHYPSMVFD